MLGIIFLSICVAAALFVLFGQVEPVRVRAPAPVDGSLDNLRPKERLKPAAPNDDADRSVAVAPREAREFKDQIWVGVLLPARLHGGPSVETPITGYYAPGTPLRVTGYRQGWFEVAAPNGSSSGWIFWKYVGAIGEPLDRQIAAQKKEPAPALAAVEESLPAKRFAKKSPAPRSKKAKARKRKPAQRYADFSSFIRRGLGGS